MTIYTVRDGDSLYTIARRFGKNARQIAQDNVLAAPDELVVGQTLVLLDPIRTDTAVAGDTVYTVAERNGVSANQLWRNNPILKGGREIEASTVLNIELPAPRGGEMSVIGYAYPFIDRALLRQTLPYLTFLSIFSYGIRPDGSLIDVDDDELIALARQYGVAPVMHLSTLTEDGRFSNALARQMLSDPARRTAVIESVREVLSRKPYVGVDVDFEYVGAENADGYVAFLQELSDAITPLGYEVWVALAPKVRSDQEGILYEGHDYGALGAIADRSLLMTYEWGYTYGPARAVSPLDQVRRVVQYGVSEIAAERILLGVPNYGYNWTLPYVAGESRARSLGNEQAVREAWEVGARIDYDTTSQAPNYHYFAREDGRAVEHEVWFEDARSVQAMLSLVPEFGLDGIAVWNLMRPFVGMWLVLNSEYIVRRVLE